MRQTIAGLIAGAVLAATIAASPAQACQVTDPCGGGYGGGYGYYGGYGYHGSNGYGARGYSSYERLPDPAQQYYWVNQGPTYTGPGSFAPVPTYQERAVNGWRGYSSRPYRYGYTGGPYAHPSHHFYDGAPNVQGPVVYSYRWGQRNHYRRSNFRPHRRGVAPKYYYASRSGYAARHGYAARAHGNHAMGYYNPRVIRAPRDGHRF